MQEFLLRFFLQALWINGLNVLQKAGVIALIVFGVRLIEKALARVSGGCLSSAG
jgi:hypothetical protein